MYRREEHTTLINEEEPKKNSKFTVACISLLVASNVLLIVALVMVVIYFTLGFPYNPKLYQQIIYPEKLRPDGSVTVGMFSPASPVIDSVGNITAYKEKVISQVSEQFYGTKVKFSAHSFDKDGYLAGTDEARVSDIHALLEDSDVTFLMANRGGWGCNRILSKINYDLVKQNPVVIMGYSDLTGCLNAIFFSTGMITFHGPMGVNSFTKAYNGTSIVNQNTLWVQKLLYSNELVKYVHPVPNSHTVIKSGKAKGRLIGGNMSVFVAMIGTKYLPPNSFFSIDWKDVVLFFEDVTESPQHIDKFLTQLRDAGILDNVAGFVFGTCNDCGSTADEITSVLRQHVKNCPAFTGALIGHDGQQFTLPIGGLAEIDSDAGEITLLEKALSD
jgi:muramoyltetrapeptide carboxypeptidase